MDTLVWIAIASCAVPIAISMLVPKKSKQGDSLKVTGINPRALKEFLNRADDAYILTHETIDINYFSKYATSRVCNQVVDDIHKKPPKMFGTKNYRNRQWTVLSQEKNEIVLQKDLTHKHIQVKKGIKIALGDDITECWRVTFDAGRFLVEDVF